MLDIGLLTGHVIRSHLYKLELVEQKTTDYAEKSARTTFTFCVIVLRSFVKDKFWNRLFLDPKNLAEKGVSSLLSLLSNTRLGLLIQFC